MSVTTLPQFAAVDGQFQTNLTRPMATSVNLAPTVTPDMFNVKFGEKVDKNEGVDLPLNWQTNLPVVIVETSNFPAVFKAFKDAQAIKNVQIPGVSEGDSRQQALLFTYVDPKSAPKVSITVVSPQEFFAFAKRSKNYDNYAEFTRDQLGENGLINRIATRDNSPLAAGTERRLAGEEETMPSIAEVRKWQLDLKTKSREGLLDAIREHLSTNAPARALVGQVAANVTPDIAFDFGSVEAPKAMTALTLAFGLSNPQYMSQLATTTLGVGTIPVLQPLVTILTGMMATGLKAASNMAGSLTPGQSETNLLQQIGQLFGLSTIDPELFKLVKESVIDANANSLLALNTKLGDKPVRIVLTMAQFKQAMLDWLDSEAKASNFLSNLMTLSNTMVSPSLSKEQERLLEAFFDAASEVTNRESGYRATLIPQGKDAEDEKQVASLIDEINQATSKAGVKARPGKKSAF